MQHEAPLYLGLHKRNTGCGRINDAIDSGEHQQCMCFTQTLIMQHESPLHLGLHTRTQQTQLHVLEAHLNAPMTFRGYMK